METAVVGYGQNLFDISLMMTGDIENVFEIAIANGLSITSPLEVGQELVIPSVSMNKVLAYYKLYNIKPSLGLVENITIPSNNNENENNQNNNTGTGSGPVRSNWPLTNNGGLVLENTASHNITIYPNSPFVAEFVMSSPKAAWRIPLEPLGWKKAAVVRVVGINGEEFKQCVPVITQKEGIVEVEFPFGYVKGKAYLLKIH